ncbi:MAG TPA: GNAT family N-acetyltransferase [Allosphingosinicella sp.]|nr:GNAT family N-acetyltransferase [Allosphingosinicella sp.]
MIVRPATLGDAAAIAAIYASYVTDSFVSFETEAPDEAEMRRRIESGGLLYPWLVGEAEGRVCGYASASPFRTRAAYRHAVETSVYLAPAACGRGFGRALYRQLLDLLARQGFTQAIGAISLPNEPSVRLHEALGFTQAGTYSEVGWKCGRWIDVGLWQRALAAAAVPPAEPKPFAEIWGE